MTSSIKTKKDLHDSTGSSLRPVGGAAALPKTVVPTPPAEVGTAPKPRNLSPVTRVHLDVAPEAARELRASTTFSTVIGPRVAHAAALADAIDFAFEWNRHVKAAEAWQTYAMQQSRLAWNYVIAQLDAVRGPLLDAEASDPTVLQELGAFMRLVTARADASRRAVETRRSRKAAVAHPGATSQPGATSSSHSTSAAAGPTASSPMTTSRPSSSLPS